MAQKTNNQLAEEQQTTSRQISKSRKRGYIQTNDGTKVRYTAPEAIHINPKKKTPSTKVAKFNH